VRRRLGQLIGLSLWMPGVPLSPTSSRRRCCRNRRNPVVIRNVVLSFLLRNLNAGCTLALGANHARHYLRQFDSRAPVEDLRRLEGSPSEHMISLDRASEESWST
jgi:hypothetical protein